MAGLSDWKPAASDGTLPLQSEAGEFQYRYSVDWTFPIDYLVAAAVSGIVGAIGGAIPVMGQSIESKDLQGDWTKQIVSPDGAVLFEQKVELTVNMIALATVAFGGLTLGGFIWAFKKEVITTTIVNGQQITEGNPAWSYTLGGTPASEFGTMEKGGGSDYTDAGGIVADWWDSPVYKMTVPVGSKLKIIRAAAQGGITPRNLLFQFRFDESGRMGLWLDRQGAVRAAVPVGTQVFVQHTYGAVRDRFRRSSIRASNPAIWKDKTNRLWVLAQIIGGGWQLWWDDVDGRALNPLLYTKENTATLETPPPIGDPVVVWSKNFRNADGAPRAQGGSYQIAQRDGIIYFKWTADNVSYSSQQEVGAYDDKPCRILIERSAGGRETLRVTDFFDVDFVSKNGGDDWEPLNPEPSPAPAN